MTPISPDIMYCALQEVIPAATCDRVELCTFRDIIHGATATSYPLCTEADIPAARSGALDLARSSGCTEARAQSFRQAVAEACNNVIVHSGAYGWLHLEFTDLQVIARIRDVGRGIPTTSIARAILQKGWSGGGTLGMGFHLMRESVDYLQVATCECGTEIAIIMDRQEPREAEIDFSQYSAQL